MISVANICKVLVLCNTKYQVFAKNYIFIDLQHCFFLRDYFCCKENRLPCVAALSSSLCAFSQSFGYCFLISSRFCFQSLRSCFCISASFCFSKRLRSVSVGSLKSVPFCFALSCPRVLPFPQWLPSRSSHGYALCRASCKGIPLLPHGSAPRFP